MATEKFDVIVVGAGPVAKSHRVMYKEPGKKWAIRLVAGVSLSFQGSPRRGISGI